MPFLQSMQPYRVCNSSIYVVTPIEEQPVTCHADVPSVHSIVDDGSFSHQSRFAGGRKWPESNRLLKPFKEISKDYSEC
ncbi:hypothetical protein NPIL_332871 [Nephila pilipes]|uniref:Uncharacterized protein n=1 Tax=Nephila pilipes TaxID=299642 RepID=A0A8X6PRA0_NEPPI|nr:hypothetical protein NPIL_332871 [Nephila pilipes]